MTPERVAAVGAGLGEGPVWSPREQALWFVEAQADQLCRFDPATGALDRWTAPDQAMWAVPAADGTLVAGMQSGLYRFDPATGGFQRHARFAPEARNSINDGAVAPDGTLWFSTNDRRGTPRGHLYRLDRGAAVEVDVAPVAMTNGPAVAPDGRTLYVCDTPNGIVWAVPLADGVAGAPRRFARIERVHGMPDGPTVDADGCVWIGLFGGWGVRCYDPAGTLVGEVKFPVANVTKIAFGGPDLRTAYATTARQGLGADALAAQPLAGDLFAFDPGVAGIASPPARL